MACRCWAMVQTKNLREKKLSPTNGKIRKNWNYFFFSINLGYNNEVVLNIVSKFHWYWIWFEKVIEVHKKFNIWVNQMLTTTTPTPTTPTTTTESRIAMSRLRNFRRRGRQKTVVLLLFVCFETISFKVVFIPSKFVKTPAFVVEYWRCWLG